MKTILIPTLLLSTLIFSGCSFLQSKPEPREVNIVTKPADISIYQPPLPQDIQLESFKWHVLTRENIEQKIVDLERLQGGEFVVFAVTPDAYENMSYNLQELRRYIRQQKEIIIYYRAATQKDMNGDGVITSADWLEINEEKQQEKD